jgi:1-acyl-sn-glycerol-3-phosphate acyltransferase
VPALYSFGKVTVGPALMLLWRPVVEGRDNLPDSGAVIFASNHLSVADELLIGAVVPRHVAFWAKLDYFQGTGPRGTFIRQLLHGLGAIPVHRGGGEASLSAFDAALPVLAAGGQVVIYPEGTRSPDGRLYKGRTGVARLSLQAGVPVIPVGVTGSDKVQPIGRRMPRLRRSDMTITFGKPMDFTSRDDDADGLRAITDEVMAEIQKMTGQVYVDEYAPPKDA